jgi:tetratricopeptide (TPR) repeat protein
MNVKKRKRRNPAKEEGGGHVGSRNLLEEIQLALRHHQSGNLQAATKAYQRILCSDPNQPDALHYMGVIAHQQGNPSLARQLISQAIAIHAIPDMVQNLAVVMAAQGDRLGAIEVLREGIKRFPDARMLAFNLATAQRDADDLAGGRNTLSKLLERYPDWVEAMVNLANIESSLGNIDLARQLYLRALELNERFSAAHSNLGALYAETGKLESAVFHNKRAVDLESGFAPYYYNLGNALMTAGRAGEAIDSFTVAVTLDPKNSDGWLNLAAARQSIGDLAGAIEANRRALELSPENAKVFINQGTMALGLRRYEEALIFLKRGLKLEPRNFSAWTSAAETLRQLGRIEDARKALAQASELAPTYGRTHIVASLVEEQDNNDAAAEDALKKAFVGPLGMGIHTSGADRRIEAHLRLANLLTGVGDTTRAKLFFEKAMKLIEAIRPGVIPLPNEHQLAIEPLVLFQPVGRAGSLFLHSLIDGHPEIATTPAALMKGFFGDGVWEGLFPGVNSEDWREKLVHRFIRRFEVLLDAASPTPVPGNPLGEPTNVGRGFGLCEMGVHRDQVLRIDKEKFSAYLLLLLRERKEISAPAFFRLVHQAYEFALGRPTDKKLLFLHIHNPDVMELAGCLAGNSDVRFLNIVREPLQAIESWMRMCIVDCQQPEKLLSGYQDAVERLQLTLRQASHLVYQRYPSAAIRLEDIKRNTDQALLRLTDWMGVADHPCLRESTFGGLPYEAPANVPVKGFEVSNIERKPGMLFSEHDQRVMNLLFYPIAVQYGYRTADSGYLEREIAWYKSIIAEPLDFERKILAELTAMGYQKDTSGPRRHFESVAQRCVNLLEKSGTYPAMAPWLKVN